MDENGQRDTKEARRRNKKSDISTSVSSGGESLSKKTRKGKVKKEGKEEKSKLDENGVEKPAKKVGRPKKEKKSEKSENSENITSADVKNVEKKPRKPRKSKSSSALNASDVSISRDQSESKLVLRDRSMNLKQDSEESIYTEIEESILYSSDDEMMLDTTPAVQRIFSHRQNENNEIEYFVKYAGMSYKSTTWVSASELIETKSGEIMLSKYNKLYQNSIPQPPYYDPSYEIPDRIIAKREIDGKTEYLVKWSLLDYENNTWETKDSIDDNAKIKEFDVLSRLPSLQERFLPPRPPSSSWKPVTIIPKSKSGHTPRPYQMEGLNFLVNSWFNQRNAILADEMGLGKTVQTLIFLHYLFKDQKIRGPFLIVVPLSTIHQWEREITEWTTFRYLSFYGSGIKRKIMKDFEFFYPETPVTKFHILLTTYEYVIREKETFGSIKWQCIVVDEAHRLKNHQSKLMGILHSYSSDFKLLLTGTPLQNNIGELWSLLNFLDASSFHSLSEFQEKFGLLTESDQIVELQYILKPLMLRRLKSDVEKAIAPLEEVIIECAMTQHQKLYYQSVFNKNMEYLSRGAHKANTTNLHNISMELRKVCNHPYLMKGAEDQIIIERRAMSKIDPEDALPHGFENEALVRSSGKMILLDKLLMKLKSDGHRVLIFSQMTRMLDILQDYLVYKGYKYERLDGSIRGDDRQTSIDRFNTPNSDVFVFLLCTHAGGLGINLTSADTVIIYDSDWNPQNDIQATARCHRIGQKKEVKVYRFITTNSYERKMFDRAAIKLGLDHAVLESSKVQKSEDLEKLLRLGAYYAFETDGSNDAERFGEEDIESIISRSTKIKHENIAAGDGSTFSKAHFELDDEATDVDLSAPDFWKKYLPEVVEDEILAGSTIAERRRLRREEEALLFNQPPEETTTEPIQLSQKPYLWSKRKIASLMGLLWRFGWGRWRLIYEKGEFGCDISEVKAVSHVILKWLLDANPDSFPVVEAIYEKSATDDSLQYENKFIKKNKLVYEPIVVSNGLWKLSRLEILHFLNSAVQTCSNPPDDLVVGNVMVSKPAEWWTSADDKLLIHGIFLNGYGNYENIKLSRNDGINFKILPSRVKAIITSLKNGYIRYKESIGVDLPFNYETLRLMNDNISKKDHKQIIYYLVLYGFTTPEEFREVAGLTSRSIVAINKYLVTLLKICEELCDGKEVNDQDLVEKIMIGQAQKIMSRIKFFDTIRKHCDDDKFKGDNKWLINYIAEHGMLDYTESPKIMEMFEKDPSDGKILKRIKDLFRIRERKRVEPSQTSSHVVHHPVLQINENGQPVFPMKIGQSCTIISLGKVVYDRPGFHSQRYLYTDGFVSERMYTSVIDPSQKAWYRSSIRDNGGETPLFKVEMIEHPEIFFEGPAPSNPWMGVIRAIEKKVKSNRSLTISGPEYYGLSAPIVLHLMSKMENANLCEKYGEKKVVAEQNSTEVVTVITETVDNLNDNNDLSKLARRQRKRVVFSDESDDQIDIDLPDDDNEDDSEAIDVENVLNVQPKKTNGLIIEFKKLIDLKKEESPEDLSFSSQWFKGKKDQIIQCISSEEAEEMERLRNRLYL